MASEKLASWHWCLLALACQKMFIQGHWRFGKIRTNHFKDSVVTQLSSELPRGSMLSTDSNLSISRHLSELSAQHQMVLSVATDL